MAGGQMKKKKNQGTSNTAEHTQGIQYTLLSLLTQWYEPSDPCVASRKVLKVIRDKQVLPKWSPEGGKLLLEHVSQAVKERSPSILSLLELLQEYARSQQQQQQQQQQEEEVPSPVSCAVKGYARLCLFMTGDDGGGGGSGRFNDMEFVEGLTLFFKMLLECWKGAVLRQGFLVVRSQLSVVVDSRQGSFQRRNVLKDLNDLLLQMNSASRYVLRQKCNALFMMVPQLLEEVGEYDMQASLVELMYRMTSLADRTRNIALWFPHLDCTIQSLFLTITEFDPHCRRFLNAYNASLGSACKVYTLPCHKAHIGKLRLYKPQNPSYPMFWVDFNFGFLSVVVTCQVEGATAVNDMWECLFLYPDQVQLATLTCHMHTYTLEMKYGSVEEVRDLFSMPLNEESYALLSSVVFLEFSPLEMLEKLCYHIFGSKLKVLHLEPEGCKAKKHSKGQDGMTSTSSCTHPKSSGAFTDVEIHLDTPTTPGFDGPNGLFAPPLSSTQSTVTTSHKSKKTSAVSLDCEGDVEDVESSLVIGPSKPHKPAGPRKPHKPTSSTKQRKVSEVLLDPELNSLDEVSGRTATTTTTTTTTRDKKKKGKTGVVRCNTDTSHSPHCYKPLHFTSPRPGTAVLRAGKTLGKNSQVLFDEEEDQPTPQPTPQPKPTIKNKQSNKPDSEEMKPAQNASELQQQEKDVTLVDLVLPSSNESLVVKVVDLVLPSSNESLVVAKASKTTTTTIAAADANGVPSDATNGEQDPGCHAKVTETSHVEQESKTPPCIENKTKTPPLRIETRNDFSGFDPGSDAKSSNRQTSTTMEKSEGIKKCTRKSLSRNESATNSTRVGKRARGAKKQASRRPSQKKSVKGNKKDKEGTTKDAKTSTMAVIPNRTLGEAVPTHIEQENVKEADLDDAETSIAKVNEAEAVQIDPGITADPTLTAQENRKALEADHDIIELSIVEVNEAEAVQIDLGSADLIISQSPEVEPHLEPLSHAQNKEYTAKPVISHARDTSDGTKPIETGSQEVKLNTFDPVSHGGDKHEHTDASPAATAHSEMRPETHTEDNVYSGLALMNESPLPSGQVYDEELFHSDSTAEETQDTTQPFIEPVVTPAPAPTPSPSPQDRTVPKDVDDQRTSPTPLETTHTGLSTHKSIPQTALPPSLQVEKTTANDSQDFKPVHMLKKLSMSPTFNLLMVKVKDDPHYKDTSGEAECDDPQAASGGGKERLDRERDTQGEENVHNTSIASKVVQQRTKKVRSLKYKLVEECADETNSKSVTGGLNEDSNASKNYDPHVLEDTKRSREKSFTKMPKNPLLDQQEQHARKQTPYINNRGRKLATGNTSVKEQQVSHPALITQRPTSLNTSNSSTTHRIRNKRKLFDPTAQASVVLNQPHMEERKTTLETNHKTNTSLIDSLQHDVNKMTDRTHTTKTQSPGKKRRVSRSNSNSRRSRGGRGKRKSLPPPRRASGFLEESGIEDDPHSIYSDLDSNPEEEVDSWFMLRIEKIKHQRTYSNASTRNLSFKEDRNHTLKRKKYNTKEDSNRSPNTSDIGDLSDDRLSNLSKSPLSFTTTKDTARNVHNHSLSDRSAKRNRIVSPPPVLKSTSISEQSQTSSHDEWEPSSAKKKKSKKEDASLTRSRKWSGRKQVSKDGTSLVDDSQLLTDSRTFTSAVLADYSALHESSAETLRHTSRSSVESGTSNFTNFKLAAAKGKGTRMENAIEGEVDARCPSPLPRPSQPFITEPQKPAPQVSPQVQESPVTPISTPVLFLESPAFHVLSQPPQDSPGQDLELSIRPATHNDHYDAEIQDNQMPPTHLATNSVPKTTEMVTTSPAPASTQPFRVESTPQSPQHPSHLSTIDISIIPGSDTQAPTSGPLQSTLLDSPLNKSTSPAPKFSYVAEAEASYIEKKQVVRGQDSTSHKSLSSDPVKAELRYDKDQTSLVTITTTAEIHQADAAVGELMDHSGTTTPEKNQQIETPSPPSEALKSEVREQERPQTNPPRIQPSLIQPVAPRAKVTPQSAISSFSSRMYRQLVQPQQTPVSRHESPVHPQSRNLFGTVRGEAAASEERRNHGARKMEMITALLAVQADLESFSCSISRLAHALGTVMTLFVEHWSDAEAQ
ncbi:uncharacterized protein LOC123501970 isoform X2 [Portunus trituberculatus]|uniref:uncharacterized protein LOC123501970 isoform X2 n=1 Tax=Portunus trituberculatus TaxID=210409 RepID=UPI001E1CCF75|nr:uncharacterized protein LOC123501970 isoform X2 [Portunus trituberculatus]